MSTLVRVAVVAALVPLLAACGGVSAPSGPSDPAPSAPAPTAAAPASASALPVGTTAQMTTWGSTVDLPGVGTATFTREGDDAVVTLTAAVAGVRVGLARGARIEGDVAFACSAMAGDGIAPDGGIGAGRRASVTYPDCAHGDTFAWNYMLDGERTLSVGVEEG